MSYGESNSYQGGESNSYQGGESNSYQGKSNHILHVCIETGALNRRYS